MTAASDAPTEPAMDPSDAPDPGSGDPGSGDPSSGDPGSEVPTRPAMTPADDVSGSVPAPPVGRPVVEVEPDPKAARRLNLLFVATSLTVLLVSVERFSFTTDVLLRPANFLRLHELVQMVAIIPATVLVQAGLLWVVSHGFRTLSVRPMLLFVVGVYFTATGNGVHELGSFTLQTYCDVDAVHDNLCAGLYVNDFYTGNIMFFVGALMTTTALLILERCAPQGAAFSTRALVVALVNAVVYALAIVAYAGFDRVLVGFGFTAVMAFVAVAYLSTTGRNYRRYPFTVYTATAFVLGAVVAAAVRLF